MSSGPVDGSTRTECLERAKLILDVFSIGLKNV